MRILITNDDGIGAPGLAALEQALAPLGEVYVCAPQSEHSGASRGITLRRPLRFHQVGERRFAVDGTPADSVMVALCLLLDFHPDLVVSGINNGPNLGENVFYSGTVAGAAEGAKHGIPSIAVSVTERENLDFAPAAEFTAQLAKQVVEKGLPPGVALNVNVPHPRYQGVEVTRQCRKISRNLMVEGRDPRGRPYYWMDEQIPLESAEPGSDYAAVREGRISVTPLRFDNTADDLVASLQTWWTPPSGRSILERIRDLLRRHEINFRELHHEPTRTSEDSARVRGEDLRIGGKALLIKADDEFRLFVLSAALRVDSQAIRAHLNARRTRFATAEELAELTGLVPGAVPPFGRPILPFALYVDPSVTENDRIAFNAGSLTDSMFLKVEDYLRVAQPEVFRFGL